MAAKEKIKRIDIALKESYTLLNKAKIKKRAEEKMILRYGEGIETLHELEIALEQIESLTQHINKLHEMKEEARQEDVK